MRETYGGRNGGRVKSRGAGRRLGVKLPLPPGGGWLTADLNHTLPFEEENRWVSLLKPWGTPFLMR